MEVELIDGKTSAESELSWADGTAVPGRAICLPNLIISPAGRKKKP